ncbi:MAG: lysylphosphatidylglycerol synthase transmembrane domain-containing protein [Woeseiaceae bacterium]|nr:lysylphosphatidylglycerol synthase transmembrane domain-containing protein [Woeseiaceae bacterium]
MLALGAGFSVLFLWLAVRGTDFQAIGSALLRADFAHAAPFLLALFAFYWLKSVRWADLLAPAATVRASGMFPIIMIGYAGTAVLPMQMGEFVRAFIAGRKYDLPYALVLGSIGMERVFDLMTIVALMGVILASGQAIPPLLNTAGYAISAAAVAGFLLAIVFALRGPQLVGRLGRIFRWMPESPRTALLDQLENVARGFESIRHPARLIRIVLNSLVQWVFMGVCVYLSLAALDIQIPVAGIALVLLATVIGISLPTSPGYIGNIQLAFTLALQPFGVAADEALAASVFYHVIAYASVVVVGFLFLHRMGYGMMELSKKAQSNSVEKQEIE